MGLEPNTHNARNLLRNVNNIFAVNRHTCYVYSY